MPIVCEHKSALQEQNPSPVKEQPPPKREHHHTAPLLPRERQHGASCQGLKGKLSKAVLLHVFSNPVQQRSEKEDN